MLTFAMFKMIQFEEKTGSVAQQVNKELIQAMQGVEHTGSNYLTVQLQAQGRKALLLLLQRHEETVKRISGFLRIAHTEKTRMGI